MPRIPRLARKHPRGPILLNDKAVLEPHADLAEDVDARLVGKGVARQQLMIVGADEVGRLVALETDAVAWTHADQTPRWEKRRDTHLGDA